MRETKTEVPTSQTYFSFLVRRLKVSINITAEIAISVYASGPFLSGAYLFPYSSLTGRHIEIYTCHTQSSDMIQERVSSTTLKH